VVEFWLDNTVINEYLWMAPVGTFFYEYCLVVSLYGGVYSF